MRNPALLQILMTASMIAFFDPAQAQSRRDQLLNNIPADAPPASATPQVNMNASGSTLETPKASKPTVKKLAVQQPSRKMTLPTGSRFDAQTTFDIYFNNQKQQIALVTTSDLNVDNKIIPKGSKVLGNATLSTDQRVYLDLYNLTTPDGTKYSFEGEGKNSKGNDYVRAKGPKKNSVTKKIAGGVFGSVGRGILSRNSSNTIAGDAMGSAGNTTTDEVQKKIETESSEKFSKLERNTRVQITVVK